MRPYVKSTFSLCLCLSLVASGCGAYAKVGKSQVPRAQTLQNVAQVSLGTSPNSYQSGAAGQGSDYCQRQLGTWFYCESPPKAAELKPQPSPSSPISPDEADMKAAQKFKEDMERARLIAVWNPSQENIRRYYAFQQETLSKSGLFADTVRRLIWSDPSLDYTLSRPIGASAKTQWVETRLLDRDLFFRGIYDEIGLFYLYRGDCGPCRIASPLVRAFGQRFGVTIKPISLDGSPNPEFTDYAIDQGQLKAWGITQAITPAYLIYQKPSPQGQSRPRFISVSDGKRIQLRACDNPKGCLTYLGAGVLSVDELADRLFVTLGTQPGKDF